MMSDREMEVMKVDCLGNGCKCRASNKPNVSFDLLGNSEQKRAYQDLESGSEVQTALLDFGMMAESLPPCFTSEGLSAAITYVMENPSPSSNEACKKCKNKDCQSCKAGKKCKKCKKCKDCRNCRNCIAEKSFIRYSTTRDILIPRELGIPHPMAYYELCKFIGEQWELIQQSSFVPRPKNYIHVEKIKSKPYIFKMNYKNRSDYAKEDIQIELELGARYRVDADISNCFPSIYTHAIPWAIHGKEKAKKNRGRCWHGNELDRLVRNMNDGQTSGILIGPHASSVISELILTKIDNKLIKKNLDSYIRNIDDYEFYAKDEEEAYRFIKYLGIYLSEYELKLNTKKTKITLLPKTEFHWTAKLNQFTFPQIKDRKIGFPTCKSYLQLAEQLGSEEGLMSPLKYAAKVLISKVDKSELSHRAAKNTLIILLSICINYPYICPIIGFYIAMKKPQKKILMKFIENLLKKGIEHQKTDAIAYGLYFAKKYEINLCENEPKFICNILEVILQLEDCISMILLYEYISTRGLCSQKPRKIIKKLKDFAEEKNENKLEKANRYWLLIYTILDKKSIKKKDFLLGELKEREFSFINWDRCLHKSDL